MLRKILFWSHLAAGLVAAVGIVVLCSTGVLLTDERQIIDWVAGRQYVPVVEQGARLNLDELLRRAVELNPEVSGGRVVIDRDPGAPVTFRAGRRGGLELNPYTGNVMTTSVPWLEELFRDITGWHRWFNFSGDSRQVPRLVIGISNLLFLILVLSGIYLWLPAVWTRATVRTRLFFHRNARRSGKARDFVWHHVFGIWCALPLAVLAISGSLFSFQWTNQLVYGAFGTEPVARRAPQSESAEVALSPAPAGGWISLEEAAAAARDYSNDWQTITLTLPAAGQDTLGAVVDRGNGGQPQRRDTLTVERGTGAIAAVTTFDSLPLNQRIRSTNRFLHTGEYLGVIGQTVAGLVSLFALIMVWTGLALAYRRLLLPLLGRRRPELSRGADPV